MEPHTCGRPTPLGDPHEEHAWPPSPSRSLLEISQKVTHHKISQKALSLFTTTFFSVCSNGKYLCGLRTFPVPTIIIFNAFWNNSSLVIFICEKHLKWFRQLRNISSIYLGKFLEVSRMILAPSKNYQECPGTILT